MKEIETLEMDLLEKLNADNEDENYTEAMQGASDARTQAAEEILKADGHLEDSMEWEDTVSDLAESVVFVPGHWELAKTANARALKGG